MKYHYNNKQGLTIPEEESKTILFTGVLDKHRELEVNNHRAANSRQLKARQWVKLKSGLYGWKVKAAKARSSSGNNSPAPNSAKQRPIVTTHTNPIQKISNYFGKHAYIHCSRDNLVGNYDESKGLPAFRMKGNGGRHGLSEQLQPED